jgi:membrane protease YdiL (CAAX protease family)
MLISLAFLPLMRIISLSIPFEMDLIYRITLVSIILLISIKLFLDTFGVSTRRIGLFLANVSLEIKTGVVGFTIGNKSFQLIVAITGPVLGFIEYLILSPSQVMSMTPVVSYGDIEAEVAPELLSNLLTWQVFLLLVFILVFFTGFLEEVLFRGLIQSHSMSIFSKRYSITYPAILFAVMNIGWGSWLEVIFLLPVGLFYGYVFQKTRCLYGVGLSHGLSNLTMLILAPYI